jgi:hypothetical protein
VRCSPRSSRRWAAFPIAAYGTPSTAELPEAVRKYIKAHDGMLLANHGAVTCGPDVMAAYYKMETIEHFAKISLVARLLGREHLISREEVERLQGLRGTYGIASPAPLCADPASAATTRSCARSWRRPKGRSGSCPIWRRCARGEHGRGNSANIRRTDGAHRRCRQEPPTVRHASTPKRPGHQARDSGRQWRGTRDG